MSNIEHPTTSIVFAEIIHIKLYYIKCLQLLFTKMQAYDAADHVINNNQRYALEIHNYHRENDHIVYQVHIYDTAFSLNHSLFFRFKSLRNFHLQLAKEVGKERLPEFPKTNSFVFWNRTNHNISLIKERIRELEYYLLKLLNDGRLLKCERIQYLHRTIRVNRQRRMSSFPLFKQRKKADFANECPQLYKRSPVTTVYL